MRDPWIEDFMVLKSLYPPAYTGYVVVSSAKTVGLISPAEYSKLRDIASRYDSQAAAGLDMGRWSRESGSS